MIRNEERLYHVVVSFPSLCAKEFLILKFKRNEAIYCLIGFGIGIGCCFIYRWIKNNLCYTTKTSDINNDSWPQLEQKATPICQQKPTQKKHKIKLKTIRNKFNLSRCNSNYSVTTNTSLSSTSSNCCCCCCNSKKQKSLTTTDFNEPLNDVYMNLTKFLNRQFCRNIKLRRPNHVNKQKQAKQSNKCNNFDDLNVTISSTLSSPLPSNVNSTNLSMRSSLSPVLETDNKQFKRLSSNQSIDKFLNLKYEMGPTMSMSASSSSLLSTAINYSKYKDFSTTNTINSNKASSKANKSQFSSLSSYFDNNNNSLVNNADDFSFELFANSSHRSSIFDLDDISDSKYTNQRADNLVDQSLDEALNQINKLKEDMTNLCEDIDSLYNTKSTMRLNYPDEQDEFDDEIEYEDDDLDLDVLGTNLKCNCVYSNCLCYFNKTSIFKNRLNYNEKFKIFNNNNKTKSAKLSTRHTCDLSHRKLIKRKSCL